MFEKMTFHLPPKSMLTLRLFFVYLCMFMPNLAHAQVCADEAYFAQKIQESCDAGNAPSCETAPLYIAQWENCLDLIEDQQEAENTPEPAPPAVQAPDPVPEKIVVNIQRTWDECEVTDTYGDFIYDPNGVTHWSVDYLRSHCDGPYTIILVIDDREIVYRSVNRGDERKHYRRNTNDVSYRWCRDQEYDEVGDCLHQSRTQETSIGRSE
jgi:hypothetical protein